MSRTRMKQILTRHAGPCRWYMWPCSVFNVELNCLIIILSNLFIAIFQCIRIPALKSTFLQMACRRLSGMAMSPWRMRPFLIPLALQLLGWHCHFLRQTGRIKEQELGGKYACFCCVGKDTTPFDGWLATFLGLVKYYDLIPFAQNDGCSTSTFFNLFN